MGRSAEHIIQSKKLTDKEQSSIIARKYFLEGVSKPKIYDTLDGVFYCCKTTFEQALTSHNCLAQITMNFQKESVYIKVVGPNLNVIWGFTNNNYVKYTKNNDYYYHAIALDGEITPHEPDMPFGMEETVANTGFVASPPMVNILKSNYMPAKFKDRKIYYNAKNKRSSDKNNSNFVKGITDKRLNPYYGETPTKIWNKNLSKEEQLIKYQDLDNIVDEALAKGGYAPNSGHKLIYALTKLRNSIFKDYSKEEMPSLNEFVDIICVDDLSTIVSGVGMATNLYQTNPVIKNLVDKAIKYGKNKISQIFTSANGSNLSDDKLLLQHRGADAVNLEHIFGCLAAPLPAISDPSDIPKLVYSNSFVYETILTPNSTGSVGFCLDPRMFFISTAATARFFTAVNNATGYNSGLGTGGSWTINPGPLGSSITSFTQCKLLGYEVELVPTVSFNQSEGAIVYGILMDDFDNLNTVGVCPTQSTPTFTTLSQLNNFIVTDMKCGKVYNRVIPTTDRNYLEWIQASNGTSINTEYSKFVLLGLGLDASASISLRFTIKFSVLPSIAAQALIRPAIPIMGLYTDYFFEYLRATYPDLPNWSQKDILNYYECLMNMKTDSYNKLTQLNYEPSNVTKRIGLM